MNSFKKSVLATTLATVVGGAVATTAQAASINFVQRNNQDWGRSFNNGNHFGGNQNFGGNNFWGNGNAGDDDASDVVFQNIRFPQNDKSDDDKGDKSDKGDKGDKDDWSDNDKGDWSDEDKGDWANNDEGDWGDKGDWGDWGDKGDWGGQGDKDCDNEHEVPVPGTLPLLGAGLVALGLVRRRDRK